MTNFKSGDRVVLLELTGGQKLLPQYNFEKGMKGTLVTLNFAGAGNHLINWDNGVPYSVRYDYLRIITEE